MNFRYHNKGKTLNAQLAITEHLTMNSKTNSCLTKHEDITNQA